MPNLSHSIPLPDRMYITAAATTTATMTHFHLAAKAPARCSHVATFPPALLYALVSCGDCLLSVEVAVVEDEVVTGIVAPSDPVAAVAKGAAKGFDIVTGAHIILAPAQPVTSGAA